MRVLAIETSAPSGSVALWGPEGLIAAEVFDGERNHAAELAPRVKRVLDAHGGLSAVEGYAVSIGPGSFTGLRIGVSFIKGLAAVHDRPAVGLSTLQIMAVQALDEGADHDEGALTVQDARRGEVFAALYAAGGVMDPRLPDGLYRAADVASRFGAIVRAGWRVVGDVVPGLSDGAVGSVAEAVIPSAVTVARLGRGRLLDGQGISAGALDPAYHQRSGAEVNTGVQAPDDAQLHLADDDG